MIDPDNTFIDPAYEFLTIGWVDLYAVVVHARLPGDTCIHCHITDDSDHLTPCWRLDFNGKQIPQNVEQLHLVNESSKTDPSQRFKEELVWWLNHYNHLHNMTYGERILEVYHDGEYLREQDRHIRKEE